MFLAQALRNGGVMWKTIKPFVVSIGIAFLVGGLSQLASGGGDQSRAVYESLNLPALAVPGWVFGIVWPIWFALLGIAAALVYRSPASTEKSEGLRFYELHLLILFVWPILFFKIVTYMMMSRYYESSRAAFWILIPYCAWIAYALYLNLRVAMLN